MRPLSRAPQGLALAGLLLLPLGAWAEEKRPPEPPRRETATSKPADGTSATRPAARARVWWQVPAIEQSLAIDAEQRQALDRALDRAVAARQEAGREYWKLRIELTAVARKGASDERVSQILTRLEGVAGRLARIEAELVVEALALLSAEQVAEIEDRYPLLLQRSWMAGSGGRAGPAGRFRGDGRSRRRGGSAGPDPSG